MTPPVVGVDLSLNATGIAHWNGDVEVFKPDSKASNAGLDRLIEVRNRVTNVVFMAACDLVVIEGLAFDAHDTYRWGAQLAGIVRAALYDIKCPFLLCPPGTLKKYATGNGRAGKPQVTNAAQKRLGYAGYDDNEADALWLRAIGCDLLGAPLAELPKLQSEALILMRQQSPILRG